MARYEGSHRRGLKKWQKAAKKRAKASHRAYHKAEQRQWDREHRPSGHHARKAARKAGKRVVGITRPYLSERDTSKARQKRRHGIAPPKRHRPTTRYFSIIIPRHHGGGYSPWTSHELPAGWNSRSVGSFKTRAEAHAWAKSHLAGARYRLREFESGTYRGKDRSTSKSRKPSRDIRHHHRSKSAPPFATQAKISRKIRLLREEDYPPKQAAAIAYRMYGASRKRR